MENERTFRKTTSNYQNPHNQDTNSCKIIPNLMEPEIAIPKKTPKKQLVNIYLI